MEAKERGKEKIPRVREQPRTKAGSESGRLEGATKGLRIGNGADGGGVGALLRDKRVMARGEGRRNVGVRGGGSERRGGERGRQGRKSEGEGLPPPQSHPFPSLFAGG